MAKNQKENAKSPLPVPSTFPVNAGTAGSTPTPPNLGVPTPPLPFDAMAAMNGVTPGDPNAAAGADPTMMPSEQFTPPPETLKMVQGMIYHWSMHDLKNLVTYATHLIATHANKEPAKGKATTADAAPPASNPDEPPQE